MQIKKDLKLSSKAKTLQALRDVISTAKVLPMLVFKVSKYKEQKQNILDECILNFNSKLIIRSSSQNEDNMDTSNAGKYCSITNINLKKDEIDKAIQEVINSYGSICEDDEVFIQPMLENVTMSGVLFSADIDTLAPYYTINYDTSGSTSSVTSGSSNNLKTSIIYKNTKEIKNKKLKLLLKTSRECEEIFNNNFLDIEFAFSNDELFILQVRAIVRNHKLDLSQIDLQESLKKIHKKIQKLNSYHPKLLGKKSIFGVMPDWNPAEIIGLKPKKLALSMYKELVTDKIWAYQRDNYGYRNLRSFPLLVSFFGIPFIDVRVSFNSFVPKSLNDKTSAKLVDYYLDKLLENTSYHDKVEFKIVHSCYFFGISHKLDDLKENGFSKEEIEEIKTSLLQLTNKVIDTKDGLYKKDIQKIQKLKENYEEVVNSSMSLIDKIYWLIEDCKRFGTLPFAGVARAAFIAMQFLNSMKEQELITSCEFDAFLNSLNTVSKQLNKDKTRMSKEDFLSLYGHLRPGTYDITSLRYDENYENYFSKNNTSIKDENFNFCNEKKTLMQKLLVKNCLNLQADEFILFLKEAIEAREYLKFVFTKHLSKILNYTQELGEKYEIQRDDLAHLDIKTVLNLYSTLDNTNVKDLFENDIEKNKEFYRYTKAIKLPSLIVDEKDVYEFDMIKDEASFVTLKSVQSQVVESSKISDDNLSGKIVCIKSADPGYDYLFTKNIAGLVTCYGGANSHMAIRCAELGIPAVIGCGEHKFALYEKAKFLNIDALNKQVKILS